MHFSDEGAEGLNYFKDCWGGALICNIFRALLYVIKRKMRADIRRPWGNDK